MKRATAVLLCLLLLLSAAACGKTASTEGLGNGMKPVSKTELAFAHEFSIEQYEGGLQLVTIHDGGRFLVVPEGVEPPRNVAGDIAVLRQPVCGLL